MPGRDSTDAVDDPSGPAPQLALLVEGGDRKGLLHDMTAAILQHDRDRSHPGRRHGGDGGGGHGAFRRGTRARPTILERDGVGGAAEVHTEAVHTEAESDGRGIGAALAAAWRCLQWGDVPIGAAVVRGGEALAAAGNERERRGDPTAHAEILALRAAAERVGSWHLESCTLYVTLEPCAMCAGALVLARVDRLVFGAADPKAGFAGSVGDLVRHPALNHRVDVTPGVREAECSELLKAFFRNRRSRTP